jgi:hypothetical protein
VDANFKESACWALSKIDNGMVWVVPSAASPQASCTVEVSVTADSPEHHLNEHALIDLNQELFDDAAAGICLEQRKRSSAVKTWMRFA